MLLIGRAAWEISFRKQSETLRVVTRHQYGIFALIADSSSRENQLFSQVTYTFQHLQCGFSCSQSSLLVCNLLFFLIFQGRTYRRETHNPKGNQFLEVIKVFKLRRRRQRKPTFIHSVSLIFSTSFNWLNVSEFSSGDFLRKPRTISKFSKTKGESSSCVYVSHKRDILGNLTWKSCGIVKKCTRKCAPRAVLLSRSLSVFFFFTFSVL